MRSIIYSKRVIKELLRDPLSYIFCFGFPLVMLLIMTVINNSIPKEANMTTFRIDNLAPGIAFFGLTFVMLFTALQVSKDRETAFMIRLYASPMKPLDFIFGYSIPVIVIGLLQEIITFIASLIIGAVVGITFNIGNVLLCIIILLPSAAMFIGFGMFFGTLLNDKTAPGICSIIISGASILGGVWMDIEAMGGTFKKVCEILPFYPGVQAARSALTGSYNDIIKPLIIILIYGIFLYGISALVFKHKMKQDIK